MIQVENTFQEHKDEIDLYYGFLEDIIDHQARLLIDPPQNNVKTIKLENTAISKSSFILMLYNCVESTVVNCLNAIIIALENEGCKYPDLIDEIQIATLAAYDYRIRESVSKDNRNKLLKEQADYSTGLSVVHLDIKSLIGSSSQGVFAGSLDAREIRKIFALLGLDLTSLSCGEMQQIKNCRNKLAHGECSFQDYGRNLPLQYLQVCKTNTLTYLESLINKVKDYLGNKRFRR